MDAKKFMATWSHYDHDDDNKFDYSRVKDMLEEYAQHSAQERFKAAREYFEKNYPEMKHDKFWEVFNKTLHMATGLEPKERGEAIVSPHWKADPDSFKSEQ